MSINVRALQEVEDERISEKGRERERISGREREREIKFNQAEHFHWGKCKWKSQKVI